MVVRFIDSRNGVNKNFVLVDVSGLLKVKFHKMKIKAKVELSKVEQWSTDWKNESEKANELKKLEWDMKMAIYEGCGVDLSNISIELEVSD